MNPHQTDWIRKRLYENPEISVYTISNINGTREKVGLKTWTLKHNNKTVRCYAWTITPKKHMNTKNNVK